ncbi:hypothetical protein OS493_040024 [Desmophyllum pertusum]|uniref:Apextrin C-terminal domain-containing protein n=1 Tax=Desmophyllum pertusum TaxID=174260 RepID=A0A9W9Y9L2_9CNID|nr:hypothetical protein OS493_040024 [Desmophyllum pertusum]
MLNFYTVLNQQNSATIASIPTVTYWNTKESREEGPEGLIHALRKAYDPEVRIPLTWPVGTYASSHAKVRWSQGGKVPLARGDSLPHDTEDDSSEKPVVNSIPLGWIHFRAGYIKWDDEDKNNGNRITGQLPDGVYDRNTRIEYCCRVDGYATNAIILPTESPFVMLKSNTHLCQLVRGMKVRTEYFQWDCEDRNPENRAGGSRPRAYVGRNIKIEYCYYYH